MRYPILCSGLLLLLLAGACKRNLEKYGEDFATLMKNDDGIFRGCNIGDSPDQVQQAEGSAPSSFTDNVLLYEGRINERSDYSIRYGFENSVLFEILVEGSFEESTEGIALLNGFKEYFNARYGMFEKGNGFLVWKAKTPRAEVQIELVEESEFTELGQFSLNFYKQNDAAALSNQP